MTAPTPTPPEPDPRRRLLDLDVYEAFRSQDWEDLEELMREFQDALRLASGEAIPHDA